MDSWHHLCLFGVGFVVRHVAHCRSDKPKRESGTDMKINLKAIRALVAVGVSSCTLLCQQAGAIPITGGISMAGGCTLNKGDLTLATSIAFGPTVTTTGSGTFAAVPFSTPVTMTSPLIFDSITVPVTPLWAIHIHVPTGPPTSSDFSFDLSTFTVYSESANSLELRGTGIMHAVGFEPTAGEWIGTFQTLGGTFSWSASNAAVPDGGLTLSLLGFALVGVEGLRRKLSR